MSEVVGGMGEDHCMEGVLCYLDSNMATQEAFILATMDVECVLGGVPHAQRENATSKGHLSGRHDVLLGGSSLHADIHNGPSLGAPSSTPPTTL